MIVGTCRVCMSELLGWKQGPNNDFVNWLDGMGEAEHGWATCTYCGLHLFDNAGRKACGSPNGLISTLGRGDLQLGCELCHRYLRRIAYKQEIFRNNLTWRPYEDAALKHMVAQGKSNKEIAAELRRSMTIVVQRMEAVEITRIGLQRMTHPRLRYPWSSTDDALMFAMAEQGANNIQISAVLGRTCASINRRLSKLGNPRGEESCLACDEPLDHQMNGNERRRGRKRKYCNHECERLYVNRKRREERERKDALAARPRSITALEPKPAAKSRPTVLIEYPCAVCRTREARPGSRYCDEICATSAARARDLAKSRARKRTLASTGS